MNPIKVILADDHQILRESLVLALKDFPEIEVVADVGDGRSAIRQANKLKPDVVVLDVSMPLLNGIEACRQIVSDNPTIKVIALSVLSEKVYVENMFNSGAKGYLIKNCSMDELKRAIKTVANGKIYLSPDIAGVVVNGFINPAQKDQKLAFTVLTPREREVAQLIAEGKTTKQIAKSLCLSDKTIETHRRQIMQKLNVRSIAEITKFAIREGLTSL